MDTIEAGRMKTEQVVLEFLYKVAELIIQSRVKFQTESDQHRRGNRRARVRLERLLVLLAAMGLHRSNAVLRPAVSSVVQSRY